MISRALQTLGRYLLLMRQTFVRPQRSRLFLKQMFQNMYSLGVSSIPLVLIISLFIGALLVLQIKLNIDFPWLPRFAIGYATREVLLLEFSTTIVCVILAGKVGSHIASEIGTMRVTQQIDALDVMGVNSANYVILPKIAGFVLFIPVIDILSVAAGLIGAFGICVIMDIMPVETLAFGLRHDFNEWYVWSGFIKSYVFALIISSVSSYCGYNVRGGSVEVGKASTDAVVWSSIIILFSDLLLTNLLLG
ncbi:MAG: ABC transporter permease [Bacteroidaceae bacterium]|nr:ABC transporter permease [Bacteroidaceae bacterium]